MSKKLSAARRYRLALVLLHGAKYRRVMGRTPGACLYCGAPATSFDHVPSPGYADALADMRRQGRQLFALVPACTQCNGRLSDSPIFTIGERASYLERKLSNEYEKRFSLWSDDEASEMSYHFQVMIRARRDALSEMLNRIRALQLCAIHGDEWVSSELDEEL